MVMVGDQVLSFSESSNEAGAVKISAAVRFEAETVNDWDAVGVPTVWAKADREAA